MFFSYYICCLSVCLSVCLSDCICTKGCRHSSLVHISSFTPLTYRLLFPSFRQGSFAHYIVVLLLPLYDLAELFYSHLSLSPFLPSFFISILFFFSFMSLTPLLLSIYFFMIYNISHIINTSTSFSHCSISHHISFFWILLHDLKDDFPIIGSYLVRLYYVLMGARIGSNVKIHKDAKLGQADLLTIGTDRFYMALGWLSICLSNSLFVSLFACLSVYPSLSMAICQSTCLSISPCLPFFPCISLSFWLFISLSACLSVSLGGYLSLCLSFCLSIRASIVCSKF